MPVSIEASPAPVISSIRPLPALCPLAHPDAPAVLTARSRTTGGLMPQALTPIRPYRPDSRIEQVEARIREYITNNDLQPGHRLPGESWFAAQLEVGRPLIR